MTKTALYIVFVSAPLAAACVFETPVELDQRSANSMPPADGAAGMGGEEPEPMTPPGLEVFTEESFETAFDTPLVDLATDDEGEPTAQDPNPCVLVNQDAMDILGSTCSPCHTQLNAGNFNTVLDFSTLPTLVSTLPNPNDGGQFRFVVPGDPDNSRIYTRVFNGDMPPADVDPTLPPLPRPTVSQRSILRTWIEQCFPQ